MSLEEKLNGARSQNPQTSELLKEMKSRHQSRLWFEFQELLERLVFEHRDFDASELIAQVFAELQTNLDPFVLLHLVDEVMDRQKVAPKERLVTFEKMKSGFQKHEQAKIFFGLLDAKAKLLAGEVDEFLASLKAAENLLSGIRSIPKILFAYLHGLKAEHLWSKQKYNEFFPAVMQQMAYTDPSHLSKDRVLELAERAVVSALVSNELLSFGDLIANETLSQLQNHPDKNYLWKLALIFDSGNISDLQSFLGQYQDQLKKGPLANHLDKIQRNVRVVALFDSIFLSPKNFSQQDFTFQEIANITGVPKDQVEPLIIYILSIELMDGYLDEIAEIFHIRSLKPRTLDKARIAQLKDKFVAWNANVAKTAEFVQQC